MTAVLRLVATSLVGALVAGPVVLDACMFTCHGSRDVAQGRTEQSAPSCHHVSEDADVRIEAPAAPCGHDHSPAPSTMTASEQAPRVSRAIAWDGSSAVEPSNASAIERRFHDSIALVRLKSPTSNAAAAMTPLRV